MKLIGIFLVLVFGLNIQATTPSTDNVQGDSKPLTLPDFSGISYPKRKSFIKFSPNCKTTDGRVLSQGDAGYELCLSLRAATLSYQHKNGNGRPTKHGVSFSIGD